jgi:hypothetical protein
MLQNRYPFQPSLLLIDLDDDRGRPALGVIGNQDVDLARLAIFARVNILYAPPPPVRNTCRLLRSTFAGNPVTHNAIVRPCPRSSSF